MGPKPTIDVDSPAGRLYTAVNGCRAGGSGADAGNAELAPAGHRAGVRGFVVPHECGTTNPEGPLLSWFMTDLERPLLSWLMMSGALLEADWSEE